MGPRTVVIGLGNPILGDDGVGWQVANAVERSLGARSDVAVLCTGAGGLSLMELMDGFERAVVVDAMQTGSAVPGTVRVCALAGLEDPGAGHSHSAHDVSLMAALEVGRSVGARLPAEITVVAIEARVLNEFSEHLSLPVGSAVPQATAAVLAAVGEPPASPQGERR